MTGWQWALIIAGGLVVIAIVESPLRGLFRVVGDMLDGLLAELLGAAERAGAAIREVRGRLFEGSVGPLALVGALPVVVLAALLMWTDFRVTIATLQSLLPADLGDWHLTIAGQRLGLAESSALALVGLHFLAGFVLLEALGVTRFIALERILSPRALRGVRLGALSFLVLLGAISAGLAAWRTVQLQALSSLGDEASASLLPAAGELAQATAPAAATQPSTPARWIDWLPAPLLALVAFVIPVAGAVAAAAVYFLAMAAGRLLLTLGLLPLGLVGLAMRLARHLIAAIVRVAEALLDLLATPIRFIIDGLRHAWTAVSRHRGGSGRGPGGTGAASATQPFVAVEPSARVPQNHARAPLALPGRRLG